MTRFDRGLLAWSRAGLVAVALGGAAVAQEVEVGDPSTFEDQWLFEHQGFDNRDDLDATILLVQKPLFTSGDRRLEANWAVLWLDEEARFFDGSFADSRGGDAVPEYAADDANVLAQLPTALRGLLNSPQISRVRELYLEGPVEYYEGERRVFAADALYLDRIDGHGWVAGARYSVKEKIGGSSYVLKIDARWLRISADGSLQSSDARITTSEFAVPSYTIESGDLRMEPTGEPDYPWRVRMRDNKLKIGRSVSLPLPPISYLADEEGEPTFGGVRVGDEARFGTVLGLRYSRDTREDLGKALNRLLGGDDETDYRSRFRVDVTWLGSRGLLTDLESRLSSPGNYDWNINLAGVPDSDEDRGLVRVDEDERDTWRLWLRSRGRFHRGDGEYFDMALSRQTDPGVQSEFFEEEYLEFEERESYLHWRRTNGRTFIGATVSGTFDPFRSEITRLPEVRYVNERRQVGSLFGVPLLWRNDSRAAYLERKQGDSRFEPDYLDGFGETSTLRVASDQRFELPIHLGVGGLRLIPRFDARLAGWSDDGLEQEEIGRANGTAAARLTTTFWRGSDRGDLVELAPWIEVRDVVLEEESDAIPAVYDPDVELTESGEFVEIGTRARYDTAKDRFRLDLESRMTWASEAGPDGDGAWLPVAVLGSVTSDLGPIPWRLAHDGRYDTDTGRTRYTRSVVSLFPRDDVDVDVAFTMGRDASDVKLFEAVTVGVLYRFTPKWDVYGRQSWSLAGQNTLANAVGVRRYGHDLLFELEVRRRTGEGTSIGVSIKPLISARKRSERRLDELRD